ncbi:ankyrin repeat domain-containing protein [Legionella sp. WA2022007384]
MYTKSPRDSFLAALSINDLSALEYCLNVNGVSPNIRIDSKLNTAMHYAVQQNNKELVRLLLKYKIDLTYKNKAGLSAIGLAGFMEADDCLSIMAEFCFADNTRQLSSGDLALLKVFHVVKEPIDVIARPVAQTTKRDTFIQAVNKGDLLQVKACLDSGFSINIRVDKELNTAIHKAVKLNNKELTALLLQYKPELNALNKNKLTPIQLAAELEHWDCYQLIADFMHPLDTKPMDIETRFFEPLNPRDAYKKAVENMDVAEISKLLQKGVSVNTVIDNELNTILHLGVKIPNVALIRLSLEYGVHVNRKNKQGKTAFDLAVLKKEWSCIKAIVENHRMCETDKVIYDSILIVALNANQIELASALLKAGAPMQFFTSEKGKVYFKELIKNNEQQIIALLITEGKADIIKPLVLEFCKLPAEILPSFEDPIYYEEMNNPVITPAGITYEKATIVDLNRDPSTRQALTQADLIPNLLVSDLIAYYKQPGIDLTQTPPILISKETNKTFESPVVAADGITYEKTEIEKYLAEHGNLTPKGIKQTIPLYPNLLVKNLIEERNYNKPASKKELIADVHLGVSNAGQFGQKNKKEEADNNPQFDVIRMDMNG